MGPGRASKFMTWAAKARIWAAARPFCLAEAAQMVDFSLGPTGIRASAGRFVQDQGAAKPRIVRFGGLEGGFAGSAGDFLQFGGQIH